MKNSKSKKKKSFESKREQQQLQQQLKISTVASKAKLLILKIHMIEETGITIGSNDRTTVMLR